MFNPIVEINDQRYFLDTTVDVKMTKEMFYYKEDKPIIIGELTDKIFKFEKEMYDLYEDGKPLFINIEDHIAFKGNIKKIKLTKP